MIVEAFMDGTELTCGCYKTKEKSVIFPPTEVVTLSLIHISIFEEAGYTVARGYNDYKAKAAKAEKMILIHSSA